MAFNSIFNFSYNILTLIKRILLNKFYKLKSEKYLTNYLFEKKSFTLSL